MEQKGHRLSGSMSELAIWRQPTRLSKVARIRDGCDPRLCCLYCGAAAEIS